MSRNRDLVVREIDAQLFLINEERGTIHHLNETASAIWRLLKEPATANSIIQTFRFLYPEENVWYLKKSIRSLLRDLTDKRILVRKRRRKVN
ncbi:PqqD family protein [Litoreibacter halocynthiae]|uniref:PqqD family protein n=1 Tax=Litoreibacter halocynthiae TaxID=1242689 RepID=UPI00248F64E3|nr:PqqD family protein [Litoreibacter halocynthiae]